MTKQFSKRLLQGTVISLLGIGGVILAVLVMKRTSPDGFVSAQQTSEAPSTPSAPVPHTDQTTVKTSPAARLTVRPFATTVARGPLEWTGEDGRDTNIIRRLAHSDLEYQRMVEENTRIQRRQLVYRNDPAAAVIQRARLTGEPVRQLTLPGLDGREIQFEITHTELAASGQQGNFSGRVVGRADSTVTFAFKGGREAFTILSPSDKLYLQADPYEPGQVLVKEIDPATYVVGVCGTP